MTVPMARPTSMLSTAWWAGRVGAAAAGRGGGGAELTAGLAAPGGGGAEITWVTFATPDAVAAGAAVAGILMDGPPEGLGGRLMRTVCFLAAASAGAGPGVPAGGIGGLISAIKSVAES